MPVSQAARHKPLTQAMYDAMNDPNVKHANLQKRLKESLATPSVQLAYMQKIADEHNAAVGITYDVRKYFKPKR